MPMPISSPAEYEAVVDACWFKEDHRISQGYVRNRLSNLFKYFYTWPARPNSVFNWVVLKTLGAESVHM